MTAGTRLEVQQVSKHFGGVAALRNVSLSMEGPGIVGLIGPNGSGKSTLLGILSGLILPSAGEVYIGARRMTGRPPHAFTAESVCRTFQHVRLIPVLRVWENIAVGIRESPRRRRLREQVEDVAERLGVHDVLNAWPGDLPAGIQRRVQVAAAVISSPRVVLLDEPAAGLTDNEAADLVDTIRSIAARALVVVVEHNMQLIYSTAARVVVLMEGALVADGTPAAVALHPKVQEAYLGTA